MKVKKGLLLSFLLIGALIGSLYIHSTIATLQSTTSSKNTDDTKGSHSQIVKIFDEYNNNTDDEGDHNGGTPDNETHDIDEEQNLQYEFEGDDVNIKSYDNQIKMYFDKPQFKFEYQNQTTEVSFEFKINKIIEFNDSNGNSMIDKGEILYEVELEHLTPVVKLTNYTDPVTNNTFYTMVYNYTTDNGISLIIKFTVAQKDAGLLDGGADSVKYNLIINQWPWKSPNSILGVTNSLQYSYEFENETEMYNETGTFNDTEVELSYIPINQTLIKIGWNRDIIKDGANDTLLNLYVQKYEYENEVDDEVEREAELKFVSVYPHFTESLEHDPIIGIVDDPSVVSTIAQLQSPNIPRLNITTAQILAVGLFATIVLGLAAATIIRRKKE